MKRLLGLLLTVLLLASCRDRLGLEDIPTVANIDAVATETILTQNAPPPGYRDGIEVPELDAGLNLLPGWRSETQFSFDGVFARTPRTTSASTSAQIWFNQLASAQRVVLQTSGDLLGENSASNLEGVRLGPDAFLVVDGTCRANAGSDAEAVADLSVGALIGGVSHATPAGQRAVINGEEVWRYAFTANDLVLPNIRPADDGQIVVTSGELWFAPKYDAVIRFWLLLDVENVVIFGGESQLPVSGQVIIRYDLYDIGVAPNITVPFGC